MRCVLCLCLGLMCSPVLAQDKAATLHEAAETIRYIWKEWMEKGKLKCDPISESDLPKIHGNWTATYKDDEELVTLDFAVRANGTWSSKEFWPEMKDKGYWYLAEGMLVLFDGSIEKEGSDFATAIILRKGEFYVLNANASKGLVPLVRVTAK